ncbi:hypothetical protein RHSIM_RhsimUnG0051500 [Rhododendron simsii]|uniref:Orn/Lys/Arg decarboxylases family 1 pyridoxal-P attachment site domain-containing protein n=1 Tax=Rhododendron simsii TaxID=118357 RepID=A0A834L2W2_RHOSS|nr:hypothetical protein RHSIM_RhsimUnG0051500 [Rhododendron simsii]
MVTAFVEMERSIIELGNKQDKTTTIGKTRIVTKDCNGNPTSQKTLVDELPPLVSALKSSAQQNAASFHFPGHNRGRAAPSSLSHLIGKGPFLHDLPELPELDNLFSPAGPILDAQKQVAKLFGASETWFLVGGTTCGIQAAVMATCSPGHYLILPRNSDISAISAMVLSGALPKYIIPEYDFEWNIAGGSLHPSIRLLLWQVDKAIQELEKEGQKPAAVFVTSLTYHGVSINLTKISKLCHLRRIPLIVDEAHGAHLGFHPRLPYPALHQGADIAVQSTHKVLCSLTQSSMLHMLGNIVDRERICRCLQTLQSTSPSYLLLASFDAARAQLSANSGTVFNQALELAVETKNTINEIPGISVLDFPSFSNFPAIDPLRLSIGVWLLGLSGFEADEILCRDYGVVPELIGIRSITLAVTLGTCRKHIQRLVSGLRNLSATNFLPAIHQGEKGDDMEYAVPFNNDNNSGSIRLSPREAFFARKRKLRRCKGAVISGAADPLLSSIVICSTG